MTHSIDYAHSHMQGVLMAALQERFQSLKIVAVNIDEDEDSGNGRLLKITVYFEGPSDAFANGRPIGLTSLLEDRLAEISEAAFPVLSFVSAREQRAS